MKDFSKMSPLAIEIEIARLDKARSRITSGAVIIIIISAFVAGISMGINWCEAEHCHSANAANRLAGHVVSVDCR